MRIRRGGRFLCPAVASILFVMTPITGAELSAYVAGPLRCVINPVTTAKECTFTILEQEMGESRSDGSTYRHQDGKCFQQSNGEDVYMIDTSVEIIVSQSKASQGRNVLSQKGAKEEASRPVLGTFDAAEVEVTEHGDTMESGRTETSVDQKASASIGENMIWEGVAGDEHQEERTFGEFARDVRTDALLSTAGIHYDRNQIDLALDSYNRALDLLRANHGDDDLDVADVLFTIGNIHLENDRNDDAVSAYEESLRIYKKNSRGRHDENVATVLYSIGVAHMNNGNLDEMIRCWNESLEHYRATLLPGDSNLLVADMLMNLSDAYVRRGLYEEASSSYKESVGMYRSALEKGGGDISLAQLFDDAAESLNFGRDSNVMDGSSFSTSEDAYSDQSLNDLREALAVHRSSGVRIPDAEENDDDEVYSGDLIANIGAIQLIRGEFEDAKDSFAEALRIYRRYLDANDPSVADTLMTMSSVYLRLGEFENSIRVFEQAVRIYKRSPVSDDPFGDRPVEQIKSGLLDVDELQKEMMNLTKAMIT